jgi:cytoskeletal protein RodZ
MVRSQFITRRIVVAFVALVFAFGCLAVIAAPAMAQGGTQISVETVGDLIITKAVNTDTGAVNISVKNTKTGTRTSTTSTQDGTTTTTTTSSDGSTTTTTTDSNGNTTTTKTP